MSSFTVLRRLARAGLWPAALMLIPGVLAVGADPQIAIFARAYNGYTRTRLADNSFKPETYTFAKGGRHDGRMVDKSIDDLSFYSVARTIAGPLKQRGYIPSFDPKHVDLAIFVFWGTTTGAEGGRYSEGMPNLQNAMRDYASTHNGEQPAFGTPESNLNVAAESEKDQALMMMSLDNDQRDQNNLTNAGILGYREDLRRAWEIPWFPQYRDVISELEWDRYFVVLKAFDYHALVVERRWKLMWEARFSIPARGNAFNEKLAAMTTIASQYFGENVKHLVREAVREGKVEIGTPKVIEMPAK